MAIANVATITASQSKSAGTTLTLNHPAITAGDTLLIGVVFDNTATSTPTISSITKEAGESNDWVNAVGWDSPTASSAGGTMGRILYIKTSTAWSSGTKTITFSASITAKVVAGYVFSGMAATHTATNSAANASSTVSMAPVSRPTNGMVMLLAGRENTSTGTITNGPGTGVSSINTTGGATATNQAARVSYALTGTFSSNITQTVSNDVGLAMISFDEAGPTTYQVAGTVPVTAGATGNASNPASALDDLLLAHDAWWDVSDASSVTEGFGDITALADKSAGGANDLTAASTAPLYALGSLNGLDSAEFLGGEDLSNPSASLGAPLTIWVAFQMNATGAGQTIVGHATAAIKADGTFKAGDGSTMLDSGVTVDTSAHVILVVFDGGSSVIRIDGTQVATGNTGFNGIFELGLGFDASTISQYANAYIGESGIYSGVMAPGDITLIENYLIDKWIPTGGGPQSAAGTAAVVAGASGAITKQSQVSGTIVVASATTGAVTRRQQVAGTAPVVAGTTGSITKPNQSVAGTAVVVSNSTGSADITSECVWPEVWTGTWCEVVSSNSASGTVPVSSATSGSVTSTQSVSGTVAVVANATGAVTKRSQVSGTVPVVVTATGTVTKPNQQVSGTVPVVAGATGTVVARMGVAGTVPVVAGTTGAVTARIGVSGTAPVVASTTGAVTRRQSVSGTVPVVANATGAVTLPNQPVSGTVVVVVDSTGSAVVTPKPVSGTVAVQSNTTGDAARIIPVSGTVAVTSATAGTVTKPNQPVGGTVAVTSNATGTITSTQMLGGITPVVVGTSGTVTKKGPVAGTVPVTAGSSGSVTKPNQQVSGTVPVISNASGAAEPEGGAGGIVTVSSNTTGSVTVQRPVSGTVVVTSAPSGTVTRRQTVSGLIVVTSTAAGSVTEIASVSGQVNVVAGSTGALTRRQSVAGTIQVVSAALGTVGQRQSVSGSVLVASSAEGYIFLTQQVGGNVVVLSTTYGTVELYVPDDLPTDLTLIPSGPGLSLTGTATEVGLTMRADRLPLGGDAAGYSLSKTAERLTLEGSH